MSEQSKTEGPTPRPGAGTSISDLMFLIGVGAIVATVIGGSCSTNTRIADMRADMSDLRADMRADMRDLRAHVDNQIGSLRAEVRAEVGSLRAEVGSLRDSTNASFATVHRQLSAVAVCLLELRNLVIAGDGGDREHASTACDTALEAILSPPPATTGR